jgi:xylulokinase
MKKEYAQACGLKPGLPVVAGCGDSAATCLGAGIVNPGQVFDVAGTASILSCCVDEYRPDTKHEALMLMPSVIDGQWMPLAYINGGGLCLKWFKDSVAGVDCQVSYDTLESEAAGLEPGSEGLIFVPHFAGRVCPNDPHVRGSFIGLNWAHKRGHLYRAVMEGIAYEYKYYLNVLKDSGIDTKIEKVFVMGGGAKSALFNSIKADVLGLPYVQLKNADTAALGSAIVAGFGVGIFDDIAKTAGRFTRHGAEIACNAENHQRYIPFANAYMKSFSALRDIFKILKEK